MSPDARGITGFYCTSNFLSISKCILHNFTFNNFLINVSKRRLGELSCSR
jgi:hypothetical protein